MAPASRFVIRSTGCGRFLGILLILIALIVLLANSGLGIPSKYARWWPVIVIALGVLLLIRHYWNLFFKRNRAGNVFEAGVIPRLGGGDRSWRPPALPIIIIALGVWRLAVNFHWVSTPVLVAILLLAIGALLLSGSVRASMSRT